MEYLTYQSSDWVWRTLLGVFSLNAATGNIALSIVLCCKRRFELEDIHVNLIL